jgi:hypothetical protein
VRTAEFHACTGRAMIPVHLTAVFKLNVAGLAREPDGGTPRQCAGIPQLRFQCQTYPTKDARQEIRRQNSPRDHRGRLWPVEISDSKAARLRGIDSAGGKVRSFRLSFWRSAARHPMGFSLHPIPRFVFASVQIPCTAPSQRKYGLIITYLALIENGTAWIRSNFMFADNSDFYARPKCEIT